MADINRVVLTGRLAADPELRYTQAGQAVTNFRIAVNRRWLNNETGAWEEFATFVPIVVWGKQAENCSAYLQKGRRVAVEGRLRIRSFETQDGDRRRVTEVVAGEVHFLEPKPQGDMGELETERSEDMDDSTSGSEQEVPF
ncbi:MAG: single-stranded DNA-binding protein [Candidatus Bipolaricaulota bacterium]